MQLVGRMHSETNEQFRDAFLGLFAEVGRRFTAALSRALPGVEAEEVMWRLHFVIGSLAHTLVWEQCCDGVMSPPAQEHDDLLEALSRFAVAGMRAPGSAPAAGVGATDSSQRRHARATADPSVASE